MSNKKTYTIIHPSQLVDLADEIGETELPCTVTVEHASEGDLRSLAQNRLMHKWFRDLGKSELGMTADEARAWCKLHIGVPLLREESETFREQYDRLLKKRSYKEKIDFMVGPMEVPVTSLMTPKQMTSFLNTMHTKFGELGIQLALPDESLIQQPSKKGTKWSNEDQPEPAN